MKSCHRISIALDRQLGRLFDALREPGLDRDALVLVTDDQCPVHTMLIRFVDKRSSKRCGITSGAVVAPLCRGAAAERRDYIRLWRAVPRQLSTNRISKLWTVWR